MELPFTWISHQGERPPLGTDDGRDRRHRTPVSGRPRWSCGAMDQSRSVVGAASQTTPSPGDLCHGSVKRCRRAHHLSATPSHQGRIRSDERTALSRRIRHYGTKGAPEAGELCRTPARGDPLGHSLCRFSEAGIPLRGIHGASCGGYTPCGKADVRVGGVPPVHLSAIAIRRAAFAGTDRIQPTEPVGAHRNEVSHAIVFISSGAWRTAGAALTAAPSATAVGASAENLQFPRSGTRDQAGRGTWRPSPTPRGESPAVTGPGAKPTVRILSPSVAVIAIWAIVPAAGRPDPGHGRFTVQQRKLANAIERTL